MNRVNAVGIVGEFNARGERKGFLVGKDGFDAHAMLRYAEILSVEPVQFHVDIRDVLDYLVLQIHILISVVDNSEHTPRFHAQGNDWHDNLFPVELESRERCFTCRSIDRLHMSYSFVFETRNQNNTMRMRNGMRCWTGHITFQRDLNVRHIGSDFFVVFNVKRQDLRVDPRSIWVEERFDFNLSHRLDNAGTRLDLEYLIR